MGEYSAKDIMVLRQKTSAGIALCKEALESSGGDLQKAVEYINSKSDVVNRIYLLTGAKLGLIKIALQDAEQDFEKAISIIKERGWENENVADNTGPKKEGAIGIYLHGTDKKTAAMVEVHCLTDFVAKNEKFLAFIDELAKQAAAMKPTFVSKDSVSKEKLEELKTLFNRELEEEGKPENIREKIIEGKFSKYYEEHCLLSQKWFKDESKTMQNLLEEVTGQLGEPLTVARMVLWELGK